MRLKSFHAKTMADAMKLVREALGDDAIIVATREEESGGVRVTAAVEEEDQYGAPAKLGQAVLKPPEPEIDVAEVVSEALHRHGVPTILADRLVDAAAGLDTSDPTLALGSALDSVFSFLPLADLRVSSSRVMILVGPPGGGKTLAVAKLAARAVLKNRSVGVISTDTARAGGLDQLAAFTRILKVKLASVEDPDALAGAVEVHRNADLVLIDSAGRNPFDPADMEDLTALVSSSEAIEPVLVLPAGMDAFEGTDVALSFKPMGVRRVLATRLDATRRFGSLLVTAQRSRLAFSDASVSPKVAEGLTPLNPVTLARLMMPGYEKPAVAKPSRTARTQAKADTQPKPQPKPQTKPSSRTLP